MARVDVPRGPREFSLSNDDENPTVIMWRMAKPAEWDAFERANHDAFWDTGQQRMVTTSKRALAAAKVALDFALSLIVGVRAFEVADGADGSKELLWPADREKIVEILTTTPDWVGACDLFVRRVMQAHRPATESAIGGAGN